MSTNRSRRIDRAAAEQLFGGATVDPEAGLAPSAGRHSAPGRPELSALLAAAAAHGAEGDGPLPGEEEAMAAFRQAARTPAPQHRRRTMADTALARALSAKALAIALGVTAVGGVAVAASTGRLPEVLGGSPDNPPPAVASATHSSSAPGNPSGQTGSPRAGKSASATARPGGGDGGRAGTGSTDPSALPDLAKQCRTFADRVSAGAKAKDAATLPELAELLKAADGFEKVTGYCAALAAGGDQQGDTGHGRPSATTTPSPSAPTPSPSRSDGRRGDPQQSKSSAGGGQD
ncbi:hypothetical protein AB0K51_08835 [Kitasatospora sp. NPDC049285]|uniref:hypothetical protein n=1 Tax=Kitasatospora sp. NPDC049285 TaxID=3157096 RepID=UPI003434316A